MSDNFGDNTGRPMYQSAVHAPVDTSFTGRVSAAVNKWGMTSNLLEAAELGQARSSGVELETSEQQLLSGVPEAYHYKVLEEQATHGNYSARVMRDQLIEDASSDRVMDNTGPVAQLGYGLLAVADPTLLIPGSVLVKGGMKAGQVAYNATTRGMLRAGMHRSTARTAGNAAKTVTAWGTGAASESAMYNSSRLIGDHLYEQDQFIQDVAIDTLAGIGIGSIVSTASHIRKSQRRANAAKHKDIVANAEIAERRANGDWSDFELDDSMKELSTMYGDKRNFADNNDKWMHSSLIEELGSLEQSIVKIQGLQGDAGLAMKDLVREEVDSLIHRGSMHNRTPEDAIALLDDIAQVNTRLANVAGDYKQVLGLQGVASQATTRNILRESMERTLESVVGASAIKRLSASQAKRVAAMKLSGAVKATLDLAIGNMKLMPEVAGEIAMLASKMEFYYKGKLPHSYSRGLAFVAENMRNGDLEGSARLMRIMNKSIPEQVHGYEFNVDYKAGMANSAPSDILSGDLPAWQVKEVLDGMENTEALREQMSGANAVFGNIDEKNVAIPAEVAKVVGDAIWAKSTDKVTKAINTYSHGEMHITDHALVPKDFVDKLGTWAGQAFGLTVDLSTSLRKTKSTTLSYIGSRFTEIGKGYGGSMKRQHTAAVIKEAELTQALAKVLPTYYKSIRGWLSDRGANAISTYNAANQSGLDNALANQFNREFLLEMNAMKLGKPTTSASKHVKQLVKDWEEFTGHNHNKLVENSIEGFHKDRKLDHYVTQAWQKNLMVSKYADDPRLRNVLVKGYSSAGNTDPEGAADALLKWANSEVDDVDIFMPKQDSRSQVRTEIDWAAEVDGLSVMDLLDTEVPALATKYANRTAGWVGIAKSSNGTITSGTDLNVMREMVKAETGGDNKAMDMFDDVFDLTFGRPTRGGTREWSNNLKKLATLSRMGGLGTAQAAETGVVATRAIMEASQDVRFLKKILSGGKGKEAYEDLQELTRLSGYDEDYALLSRASTNLDVQQGYGVAGSEHALNKVTDVLTYGAYKDSGMRALGQVTGYDSIRKYQSYVAQRSFGMAVARHFKTGKSKISNARLADYGLTDVNGNNKRMKEAFNTHVEFDADGYPTKYNFDKWDADVLDEFRYSMQRMEAQTQLRALAGELPAWMNKPAMGILMQFRQMGITANNKSLSRNAAFGDVEAITELTLATMSASAVRAAKLAGLAAMAASIKGSDWEAEYNKRVNLAERNKLMTYGADMYVNSMGVWADVSNTGLLLGDVVTGNENIKQIYSQVPMLGLIDSMARTGMNTATGDWEQAYKNAKSSMILGNTALVTGFSTAAEEAIKD